MTYELNYLVDGWAGQVWQMFNTYCSSIQPSVETTDLEFRLMVNMQTKGNEKFSTEKS